jgi:hypothetical protein
VFKINAIRAQADADAAKATGNDALHTQLTKLSGDADEIRRKIVATKEGGAITGEQRLREYTDELYGDIGSYDGKPTDYQIARIDALKRETDEVAASFETFEKNDLAKANAALKSANQAEIKVPEKAPDDDSAGGGDRDSGEHRRPFERD